MENSNLYIVQYNDRYGNGTDKNLECVVKSHEDFYKWLEQHNSERKENGDIEESADEFNLIPIQLFN